jgi:hypothetical protein
VTKIRKRDIVDLLRRRDMVIETIDVVRNKNAVAHSGAFSRSSPRAFVSTDTSAPYSDKVYDIISWNCPRRRNMS